MTRHGILLIVCLAATLPVGCHAHGNGKNATRREVDGKSIGQVVSIRTALDLCDKHLVELGRIPAEYYVRDCEEMNGYWAIYLERRVRKLVLGGDNSIVISIDRELHVSSHFFI